jgi:tRNA pseudouridine38-40 synthase
MPRYFLEVAYFGEKYSGFQVQDNAKTIQSEVEQAFYVIYKKPIKLTGSSRTDSGVHAFQNFFHFDWSEEFNQKHIYNINAILPADIVLTSVRAVRPDCHARFDAISREYEYHIYFNKNPFLQDRAWFFPFKINPNFLHQASSIIKNQTDFTSFSRQNTQVKTFSCNILESSWEERGSQLIYHVVANRFLRGMVRALVSTMLQVARGNKSLEEFNQYFTHPSQASADFSAPAKGLFLHKVNYPDGQFLK